MTVVVLIFLGLNSFADVQSKEQYEQQIEALIDEAERYIGSEPFRLDSMAQEIANLAQSRDDYARLAMANMYDGISSAMKNDFGPALQSFQLAWQIGIETDDRDLQVHALTNMAGVYKYAGKPSSAEEKLIKAIELLEDTEWQQTLANNLLALAIIQEENKKIEVAKLSVTKAMDIFEKEQNISMYLSCVEQLGGLLERSGNLNDALKVYRFAINGRTRFEESGLLISLHRNIGSIHLKQRKYDLAKDHLELSLHLSDSLQNYLEQDSTLVKLIHVSATMGEVEKTNYYTQRLVRFHRMQEEKHVEETLASLETEYLLNEQKLENRALKAESEQAKLQLSRNRAILYGLLAALALLIAITIIAIAFIRRVRAFNDELEQTVAEKTAEVVQRNDKLRETSFQLAHELRSCVSTLLGAKHLLDEKGLPGELDMELYEAIGESTERMDVTIKAMIRKLDEDEAISEPNSEVQHTDAFSKN